MIVVVVAFVSYYLGKIFVGNEESFVICYFPPSMLLKLIKTEKENCITSFIKLRSFKLSDSCSHQSLVIVNS